MSEWIPVWKETPPLKEEVAVLIILADGSMKRDIGRWFGPKDSEGWSCQFWNERPRVAAWVKLPPISPPAGTGE